MSQQVGLKNVKKKDASVQTQHVLYYKVKQSETEQNKQETKKYPAEKHEGTKTTWNTQTQKTLRCKEPEPARHDTWRGKLTQNR